MQCANSAKELLLPTNVLKSSFDKFLNKMKAVSYCVNAGLALCLSDKLNCIL